MRLVARLAFTVAICLPRIVSAAALVRGPFLQQTGPHSSLVVLHTDVPASVRVVAELGGGRASEGESAGTERHVVPLGGLPAASVVSYRVEIDGAVRATGTIRTPGEPGTAAGRRTVLGVIGDFGTQGPIQAGNTAALLARGVSALLTVGDNAYPDGKAEDWDPAVFRPMAALLANTTFFPVPGDHEYRQPYAQPYLDAFELPAGPDGERYYAFDWGDVHVLAIDSNCLSPMDAAVAGCTRDSMIAWLREDLARAKAPWKIALFHRPALATGKYGSFAEVASALVPLFQEFGVDVVFQGHNHLYERTWPSRDGAPVKTGAGAYDHPGAPVYVTAGGGGDWLYDFEKPVAPFTAYREKVGQHVVVTVDGGSMHIQSVRFDGVVHDELTIVKDVPPVPEDGSGGSQAGVPDGTASSTGEPSGAAAQGGCATGGSVSGLAALAAVVASGALGRLRRRAR
ncbi:MAG TPA: metallophosphoesterase [Anaeromyxobacter sp.]|nr:metallophosphoesterase [Anaeromyxobacter sp.]